VVLYHAGLHYDTGGVYSPEIIVCEKLRAICQQMTEYAQIISSASLGNQCARDFIDIEALIKIFDINLFSARTKEVVRHMFEAERVPHDLHALG
jgi:hypothetical protein